MGRGDNSLVHLLPTSHCISMKAPEEPPLPALTHIILCGEWCRSAGCESRYFHSPCLSPDKIIQQNVWFPNEVAGEPHRVHVWIFWCIPSKVTITPGLWKTQTFHFKQMYLKKSTKCTHYVHMYTLCLFYIHLNGGVETKKNRTNQDSAIEHIHQMCRDVSPFAGKHWLLKSGSFQPTRDKKIHRKQLTKSQTCWTCDACPKCGDTLSTYQVYDLHDTEVELNREGMRVVGDGPVQRVVVTRVWPLNQICIYRGQ